MTNLCDKIYSFIQMDKPPDKKSQGKKARYTCTKSDELAEVLEEFTSWQRSIIPRDDYKKKPQCPQVKNVNGNETRVVPGDRRRICRCIGVNSSRHGVEGLNSVPYQVSTGSNGPSRGYSRDTSTGVSFCTSRGTSGRSSHPSGPSGENITTSRGRGRSDGTSRDSRGTSYQSDGRQFPDASYESSLPSGPSQDSSRRRSNNTSGGRSRVESYGPSTQSGPSDGSVYYSGDRSSASKAKPADPSKSKNSGYPMMFPDPKKCNCKTRRIFDHINTENPPPGLNALTRASPTDGVRPQKCPIECRNNASRPGKDAELLPKYICSNQRNIITCKGKPGGRTVYKDVPLKLSTSAPSTSSNLSQNQSSPTPSRSRSRSMDRESHERENIQDGRSFSSDRSSSSRISPNRRPSPGMSPHPSVISPNPPREKKPSISSGDGNRTPSFHTPKGSGTIYPISKVGESVYPPEVTPISKKTVEDSSGPQGPKDDQSCHGKPNKICLAERSCEGLPPTDGVNTCTERARTTCEEQLSCPGKYPKKPAKITQHRSVDSGTPKWNKLMDLVGNPYAWKLLKSLLLFLLGLKICSESWYMLIPIRGFNAMRLPCTCTICKHI